VQVRPTEILWKLLIQKPFLSHLPHTYLLRFIFLLSEFIALLWSMTKVRVRDQWGVHKEDTGRGLNSFLLVFLTSYAAFWINRFLPETPDIIYGLKGGLEVYGSMHNVLFGLCAAGIISCLIRKYL